MTTHSPKQKEQHRMQQAHMKKICEVCGAIGCQDAIITCYQCKNVDVHQYCVMGYRDEAPKDWRCQECDIDKGLMSSSRGLENGYSEGSKLHASATICQSAAQPRKSSKFPSGHCTNWEKEVQTGKTRYLPVEEALGLSSGVTKNGFPVKITGSSRVVSTKSTATMSRGNISKPRAHISNSFAERSTVQRSLGVGVMKPQNLQNAKITERSKRPVQSSKGPGDYIIREHWSPDVVNESRMMNPSTKRPVLSSKGPGDSTLREHRSPDALNKSRMTNPSTKRPIQSSNGLGDSTIREHRSSVAVNESRMMNPSSKRPVQSSIGPGGSTIQERKSIDAVKKSRMMNPYMTHPCDPALDPSWKGSFDILGGPQYAPGMFNNHIQAHTPSKVRRKVYEFSGLLPNSLKFELVPCGDIWGSLFNNRCPSKEDIGLYFFASERERSEIYMALVEFMRIKDLAMRTLINDVELLIFPSTALCSDSQRWNSKHFLWGLFYCVGQDTIGCAEGGSSKVIDMEIDMIGGEDVCTANEVGLEGYQDEVDMDIDMIAGENVGTQDIVVSRTTRHSFNNSIRENVTAATYNGSNSVTPLVSKTSESRKELIQVIKREPVDEVPPGFIPRELLPNNRRQLS